jgi:hypothetical protein
MNTMQKGMIAILGVLPEDVVKRLVPTNEQNRIRNFANLPELQVAHKSTPCQCIIVDFRTSLKFSGEEKSALAQLEAYILVVRLRVVGVDISAAIAGVNVSGENLEAQLQHVCTALPGKHARRSLRMQKILNVEFALTSKSHLKGSRIRSNSFDVSRNGLFLLSGNPYEVGDLLDVHLKNGPQHLGGLVRWVLPWGQSTRHFSGMGIEVITNVDEWESYFEVLCGGSAT